MIPFNSNEQTEKHIPSQQPHVGPMWVGGGLEVGPMWVRGGPHMGCQAGTHMGPSWGCWLGYMYLNVHISVYHFLGAYHIRWCIRG